MVTKQNPASDMSLPRNFRPMSEGTLKLEVPEREGYHRHWFLGTTERIGRALQAGYQFVDRGDVSLTNFDLSGAVEGDGNSDLGTRVTRASGDLDKHGNSVPLVLMECPNEFYQKSLDVIEKRNAAIADSITQGRVGAEQESASDTSKRYVGKIPDFFNPNKRRP